MVLPPTARGAVLLAAILLACANRPAKGAPPGAETYRVVGVKTGDTLTVRKHAGATAEVVAQIPANQRGLEGTGRTETVAKSTWVEVKVGTQYGWVNRRFLQAEGPGSAVPAVAAAPPTALPEDLKCGNSEPPWLLEIAATGQAKADDALEMPVGARVVASELAAGRKDVWYLELGERKGQRLMTVLVKQADCRNATGTRFKYEVFAKREGGEFLPGCCNRIGAAKKP